MPAQRSGCSADSGAVVVYGDNETGIEAHIGKAVAENSIIPEACRPLTES
jgi:hypothetical protein